jgi:molybdopterin synthase catalytic subunit
MAEKELERIGAEARTRWAIERIAIVHRVGHVDISEPSVAIAVSAAHRKEAFEACRFAIEEIKRSVPIWKKEIFEGGEIWIGTQSGERLDSLPK